LEGEEKKENSWEEQGTLEGKDGFSGFLKLRLLLRQDEVLELFMEVEVEVTEIPNGMLRISWTTISLSFPTESEALSIFAPRQLGLMRVGIWVATSTSLLITRVLLTELFENVQIETHVLTKKLRWPWELGLMFLSCLMKNANHWSMGHLDLFTTDWDRLQLIICIRCNIIIIRIVCNIIS
jgi:hypothetical protein